MTSRPTPHCDLPTLAAFVDGTLEPSQRETVVAHLASCEDCYDLLVEVQASAAVPAAEERRPFPFRPVAGVALLAAAASLALFVWTRQGPLDRLVSAVGDQRLTEVRPSGGFRFGPLVAADRGTTQQALALSAELERLRAASTSGGATELHAYGVALLVAGQTDQAQAALDAARAQSPKNAEFIADCGAVRMTRFLTAGVVASSTDALADFDTALELDPRQREAAYNRALLLQRLDRKGDARDAWNKYLELDSTSLWAAEARRSRDATK